MLIRNYTPKIPQKNLPFYIVGMPVQDNVGIGNNGDQYFSATFSGGDGVVPSGIPEFQPVMVGPL